jgi:phospholipid/cholesterol/gamma-HCH transport system substrate-binding protein
LTQASIQAARRRTPAYVRPLLGLVSVVVIAGIVAVAVTLFKGGFTATVPVSVLSPRAGLVVNPDAKVKLRGVQVGKVASIETRPDGQAVLHLAMDPSQLKYIPANVLVNIAATTVFGAKYVQLVPPAEPSGQRMHAGQTINSQHVTVEINSIFEQLTQVLGKLTPDKLNETLGALASALNGRGKTLGQGLSDLDHFLASIEPSYPALNHDLAVAPDVLKAYADESQQLIDTANNSVRISQTVVDEQRNLDALLVSTIGLADTGNQVLGDNTQGLTDTLHNLVPTTDLTNQYNQALWCGLAGILPLAKSPPYERPGVLVDATFLWGGERYRFPGDLPKIAASGGPQCTYLPVVPFEARGPYKVFDVGTNPWRYGNQGVTLNGAGIKEWLFGPIDGPPRNTMGFGNPG